MILIKKNRVYTLLDEGKCYNKENIHELESFNFLQDVVGVYLSTLGAMGRGGLIYLMDKHGNEMLFDYFDFEKEPGIVRLKANDVYYELSSRFHLLNQIPDASEIDGWVRISSQVGWFFYVKQEYKKSLLKMCKKLVKTDPVYREMLKSEHFSEDDVLNEFILPHGGPQIFYEMLQKRSFKKKNKKDRRKA